MDLFFPEWFRDAILLIPVLAVAVTVLGGVFVYFFDAYQKRKPVNETIDIGVDMLIDGIDGSVLDVWMEEQIIAGKLPPSLATVIKIVQNVAHDHDPETESTALPRLRKYIDDLMDGDLAT
jgi:hypothetical protein